MFCTWRALILNVMHHQFHCQMYLSPFFVSIVIVFVASGTIRNFFLICRPSLYTHFRCRKYRILRHRYFEPWAFEWTEISRNNDLWLLFLNCTSWKQRFYLLCFLILFTPILLLPSQDFINLSIQYLYNTRNIYNESFDNNSILLEVNFNNLFKEQKVLNYFLLEWIFPCQMQDQSFEDKKCIEICADFEYVDGNKSVFPIFTLLTAIDYYLLWWYDNFINTYHLMH